MKPYLVSSSVSDRRERILTAPTPRVAVYGRRFPLGTLGHLFDFAYRLTDLYRDDVFFDALARVTGNTHLFLVDLGLDYCKTQAIYIKEFTKLHPLSLQAASTTIIDHFGFYFTEKAIYRPFLYIKENVLGASLQEFYGIGTYRDYEGNRVENYAPRIAPYLDMRTEPLMVQVVRYSPSAAETRGYEALKQRLIMDERKPKQTVLNGLFAYIAVLDSRRQAVAACDQPGTQIVDNNPRHRRQTYETIIYAQPECRVVFFSSGRFGADELGLEETMNAIRRHNVLIEVLRG